MNFTIVVPTCNRPERLARLLHALPDHPGILVTDDSRDNATRSLIAREFPHVSFTQGPGRGPAANRNHGARRAGGDWIFFVDDDCIPQPGWAEALAAHASAGDRDVVEGKTISPDSSDDPFEERVENLGGGVLWSCNLAIRREAFERLGGFDESFLEAGGEDMEFAWRVQQADLRVTFAPDAIVFHPVRKIGWKGLWRRTWMIRWIVLYELRTGKTSPDSPLPGVLAARILGEMERLLRETARGLITIRSDRWRRSLFHLAYRWATFPFVLPYLLYWERRFRKR